jgi:hypothetical protein
MSSNKNLVNFKKPWESFYISATFTNGMDDGEVLNDDSSTIIAKDRDGNDVSTTFLNAASIETIVASDKMRVQIQAGTEALAPYTVGFRAITDNDNKLELDVIVNVHAHY